MITGANYIEAIMTVKEAWGDNILAITALTNKQKMTFDEFLTHCTPCGGNWGGMLLTGIKKLYPEVADAIPHNMAKNGTEAFCLLGNLLILLGVDIRG